MKERPILFTGEMVRAILDGRKTQTRRVMKPQPSVVHAVYPDASADTNLIFREGDQRIHCPYGMPGDRLWVKETFAMGRVTKGDLVPDQKFKVVRGGKSPVIYRADKICNDHQFKWKPSIFMPRWASRITLGITKVRVERVQDISEADAQAEGIMSDGPHSFRNYSPGRRVTNAQAPYYFYSLSAQDSYKTLWESINGKGSWAKNPWVWVIEFKTIPA